MIGKQTQKMIFPYKTAYDEQWDENWAADWKKISEIFDLIDELEATFNTLEVSILRELSQKKLIIDLQKYAYSLSLWIKKKYK
jgi:hypothetical protein